MRGILLHDTFQCPREAQTNLAAITRGQNPWHSFGFHNSLYKYGTLPEVQEFAGLVKLRKAGNPAGDRKPASGCHRRKIHT